MINEQVLDEARRQWAAFFVDKRKRLKMSQDKLAAMSGIGIATIRRLESGEAWLNLKQIFILCGCLNINPFLTDKESAGEIEGEMIDAIHEAKRNLTEPGLN
ncbi:MAG: XRE family transcriptional regulator [Gammaproteobacteria bacterium]|nr:XRE family transcriptional regulator [Gammaproteobacteria bacterium]